MEGWSPNLTTARPRHTFAQMIQLAEQHNIEIFWFYGEAGHGKGLVDAMSSFGFKKIMRSAIITGGRWFPDTFSIYEYLDCHFHDDDSKS